MIKKALITKPHYWLSLIFLGIGIAGVFHHELWLDESHHWLLARDSNSLTHLIQNTRYEGHPLLWSLLLFVITRFTTDPIWMQFFHVGIAALAVFVFLRKSPFPIVFKILFILGYFVLYEYTLISRNYALCMLFLFLICGLYPAREKSAFKIHFLLVLLALSHALGVVIAAAFFLMLWYENFMKYRLKIPKKLWAFGLVFSIGIFWSISQILPPSDTIFFDRIEDVSLFKRASSSLIAFAKGLIFIPDFRTLNFWNSYLITALSKTLGGIIAISCLLLPYFLFKKNKNILLYIYAGIFGGSLFFFVTQLVGARYHGMLYLLFITALWAFQYQNGQTKVLFGTEKRGNLKRNLVYGVLIIQLITGVIVYSLDWKLPFTNSKQVVDFLKKEGLSERVVATKACDGTAISAYLERPIYFTSSQKYESFCVWGRPESKLFSSKAETISALENLVSANDESVIFISYQAFFGSEKTAKPQRLNERIGCKLLKKFETSIVRKGSYYVYEISSL